MTEKWIEIQIRLPSEGAEIVGEALSEIGCAGITLEIRELDTFIPPDPDEAPAEYLLRAYFPGESAETTRLRVEQCLATLDSLLPTPRPAVESAVPVGQEDWAEGWKQHFGAVRIGRRLVIKPTWESFPLQPGDAVVQLDPGMAFGTGTHATTRLCLEAMADLFDAAQGPERVLDVGTGSGILAVAAAVLGAQRVLACDIEEEACRTARENAALNGVEEIVEVTGSPLSELEGGFDLILANILAEENARLCADLTDRLAPGGALILSGILKEKEGLVTCAFAPLGLTSPRITRQEEWTCLLYRKER